jgi:hypothetical protein
MWVKKGEAASLMEILIHQVLEKRGLTGSGLTDSVEVHEPIGLFHAEEPLAIAPVRFTDNDSARW